MIILGARSPFRTFVLATLVAVVSTMAVVRSGRAADDPEAAAAKKHYEEGTKAFNLGEYPRAITEFKATYNAKPDPLLLYNIAQSYRLQGDAAQALFFYKSFLRNMPNAANRKEVEGRIKALDKQIADQKKDPASTGTVVTPPAPTGVALGSQNMPTSAVGGTAPPAAPPAGAAPATADGAVAVEMTPKTAAIPPTSTAAPIPQATLAHVDMTAPAEQVKLTASPPRTEEPGRPIYKKWWFWVGSAAAILVVGGAIAAGANKPPSTPLGLYQPTFK